MEANQLKKVNNKLFRANKYLGPDQAKIWSNLVDPKHILDYQNKDPEIQKILEEDQLEDIMDPHNNVEDDQDGDTLGNQNNLEDNQNNPDTRDENNLEPDD